MKSDDVEGCGRLSSSAPIPLWLGPAIITFGVVGLLTGGVSADFSTWFTNLILGEKRGRRYFGHMMNGGWKVVSVLVGVFSITLGVIITVAALKQR